MDAKSQDPEIIALIQRAALARMELGDHLQALRHRVDFPARLKQNFLSNRGIWFGASAVVGILAIRLLRRPAAVVTEPRKHKGVAGLALGAALALAKPAIKTMIFSAIKKRLLPTNDSLHKSTSSRPNSSDF